MPYSVVRRQNVVRMDVSRYQIKFHVLSYDVSCSSPLKDSSSCHQGMQFVIMSCITSSRAIVFEEFSDEKVQLMTDIVRDVSYI